MVRLAFVLGGALATGIACRPAEPASDPTATATTQAYVPFLERKARHTTQLRVSEPSTGRYEEGFVPEGLQAVRYPSGELSLLAWLALPPQAAAGPVPGVVYLHGDFSLAAKDLPSIERLRAEGFAVLAPALRGENGNPGRLELLYGEVDDAVAATRWLAGRPEVDAERIYAVGHSIGGGTVALLALHPEAPVRLTASVGGIYVPETFQRWTRSEGNRALVRFDAFDPAEGTLRTLGPNVRDLVHPHHAFIGQDDPWFHPNAEAVQVEAERWGVPLSVHWVPGDHMSSLDPALDRFVALVHQDLARDDASEAP